jgi:hypothetical protein
MNIYVKKLRKLQELKLGDQFERKLRNKGFKSERMKLSIGKSTLCAFRPNNLLQQGFNKKGCIYRLVVNV